MKEIPITDVLDLHSIPPADISGVVEEYLVQCREKGFVFARIIHGKGIGFQRERIRSMLKQCEWVESFEDGPDWGSTSIRFRK